jgi:hypothetical protein
LDSLHSALFYVCAAIAVVGALLAALSRSRQPAAAGLVLAALGAGLLMGDLSGGFAGLVVFVLLLGAAGATLSVEPGIEAPLRLADNLGAVVAAVLFIALGYAAYRGVYHSTGYPGGTFNAAALGRLLLGRDALALIALAAGALIGASYLPAGRRRPAR